jgi:flagellar motor switch protein FliN/FliY
MSSSPTVEAAGFKNLQSEKSAGTQGSQVRIDDLLDLPVTISMEVGRRRIGIRELLQLTAGSVISLDRDTSDAFDVYVNGALLARGDAVVVNQKCAVRLTELTKAAK